VCRVRLKVDQIRLIKAVESHKQEDTDSERDEAQ